MTAHQPTDPAGGSPRRGRDVLRGLGALIVLLALLIGLPVLLYRLGGIPIPHQVPSPGQLTDTLTRRDNGQLFLTCLLLLAWAGWAAFAASVAVETGAQLRGRGALRLPALGGVQRLAGHLVAAVAVAFLGTGPALTPAMPAHASVTLSAPEPVTAVSVQAPTGLDSPTNTAQTLTTLADAPTERSPTRLATTYAVQRGDTLWGIAEAHLGDPERYLEIARLNYGRPQPDGRALTDGHWIYPGWTLLLPADATGLPAPAPPDSLAPPNSPDQHDHPGTDGPTPSPRPDQEQQPEAGPEQSKPTTGVSPTATPTPTSMPPAATPTPAPTGSPTGIRPSSLPSSQPPTSPTTPASDHADGAHLPEGADAPLIAASVASGLATSLTVLRLRRRRVYRPSPPAPASTGPQPVSRLRRLAATTTPTSGDGPADDIPPTPVEDGHTSDATPRPLSKVEVGRRDDRPVTLDLLDVPGLAVTGPGADSLLHSLLADLLARARRYELEVLLDPPAAERLLPDSLPNADMLQRTPDAAAALMQAEIACVSRSRRLTEAGVADYSGYRTTCADDPLPLLVLLVAAPPADAAGQLSALLTVGRRLGITALVLDQPSAGMPTLTVAADGQLLTAEPATLASRLHGAQLVGLSASDAHAALAALATTAPGDLPPLTDRAPSPETSTADASTDPDAPPQRHREHPSPEPEHEDSAERRRPPIHVQLLGPIRITAWGEEIATGLRGTARELLAYYLLQPDGATAEAAINALWPDADIERGRQRFWTALGNLRSRLRGPSGNPEIQIIAKHGAHYRADPELLEVDVWQFQAALADAHHIADPVVEAAALQRAVDLYRGDLADGTDYPWAEVAREDLHRRALDALVRLADLHHDRPQQAIACLDRAIALDPYAEEIYRRLIRLHAATGRLDAVCRAYAQLGDRLADLDLEPQPATTGLFVSLAQHRRRPRSSSSRELANRREAADKGHQAGPRP